MFNILNPLELADWNRPTIGVGRRENDPVGTGLQRPGSPLQPLRDRPLITGRGGGQWGNCGSESFYAPPPVRQGKTVRAPPFKGWKLCGPPPFGMAKTGNYWVRTSPKRVVPPPPFSMTKLFLTPFSYAVKLHLPPPPSHLPFCSPSPTPRN